jgi:hypothetical protein
MNPIALTIGVDLAVSDGFSIVSCAYLQGRPKLERERFSGGVNLSAQERNWARLRDARKVYVLHESREVVAAPWVVEEIREAIEALGKAKRP